MDDPFAYQVTTDQFLADFDRFLKGLEALAEGLRAGYGEWHNPEMRDPSADWDTDQVIRVQFLCEHLTDAAHSITQWVGRFARFHDSLIVKMAASDAPPDQRVADLVANARRFLDERLKVDIDAVEGTN